MVSVGHLEPKVEADAVVLHNLTNVMLKVHVAGYMMFKVMFL